ncbi:hypothetical protein Aduo_008080 [Ancylostoma duodenale]
MARLEQIEYIIGSLTVRNNEAVPDLTFLKNLKIINNSHSEEPGLLIENNTNFNNTGLISLEKVISKTRTTTTAAVVTNEEEEKIETEDISTSIESTTTEPMANNSQIGTRKPQKKENASVVLKKKVAQLLLQSISEALDEEQKRKRISKAKDAKIIWLVAVVMFLFALAAIIGLISSIWYKKRTQRMRGGLDERLEEYATDEKYTCDMERHAHDLVRSTGSSSITGYKTTYATGDGDKFNVGDVVKSWKKQLKEMGEMQEFGCNLSIGSRYKVACVFK